MWSWWTIRTTTDEHLIMMKNPPHPGEILREDVLVPLGLEVTETARRLGMSRPALSRVLNGHPGISPDLALRLEQAGVSTARFWMNLQVNLNLPRAETDADKEVGVDHDPHAWRVAPMPSPGSGGPPSRDGREYAANIGATLDARPDLEPSWWR